MRWDLGVSIKDKLETLEQQVLVHHDILALAMRNDLRAMPTGGNDADRLTQLSLHTLEHPVNHGGGTEDGT